MGIFNLFKKKSQTVVSASPMEVLYSSIRNRYQFAVEICEESGEVIFAHFFNGIRTNKFGKTADSFNGFSHYAVAFGSGQKPVYNIFLVHLKSNMKFNLNRPFFQNSGIPTKAFQDIVNDLYEKHGEIGIPSQPQCYDVKNGVWLLFESIESRNKRRMSEMFNSHTEIVISNERYFLDEFYNWFKEDKEYLAEQQNKWLGIENGVFVDYYNSHGERKRGEITDAYSMRDYDLISIDKELEEIPLKKIIKVIDCN
jgi:hypothetical protein